MSHAPFQAKKLYWIYKTFGSNQKCSLSTQSGISGLRLFFLASLEEADAICLVGGALCAFSRREGLAQDALIRVLTGRFTVSPS